MSDQKYVMVPVEPTPEMLVAINWPNDPAGYRAMLAAAPQATAVQGEPVEYPVCCSDEPHTGTCGSSDPRALCNRAEAEPAPAQDGREVVEVVAVVKHDSPLRGYTEFMKYESWMADGLSHGWAQLMTVAQHERIVAALTRPAQTEQQPDVTQLVEALECMLAAVDNPIVRRKIADDYSVEAIAIARNALAAHQKREG